MRVRIEDGKNGKMLVADEDIAKGDMVLQLEKNFIPNRTKTSLQIDEGKHQESSQTEAEENFLNHSCEPNAYVSFDDLTVRALKDIKKGEEVTYNYLTTEWEMEPGFECKCGSEDCIGMIKGFKYLDEDKKLGLKYLLSPYLKKKLRESTSF